MKEFLSKYLVYLITAVLVIALIIVDVCTTGNNSVSEDSIEDYARGLVESSEVMVNGNLYHGVYSDEEVSSLPEGFELVGLSAVIDDTAEIKNDLESHVLPSGYEIYANENDDSCVYISISTDEFTQYLVYYKDITDEVYELLGE